MAVVLVRGDGGAKVHSTIVGSDGEPLDLSGKTVTLAYTLAGGTVIKRSMTVLNQLTNRGEAEYQLTPTDLSASGEFEAEIIIQDGQSDQLTTEKFRCRVREPKS
jgi:hypothetical protein